MKNKRKRKRGKKLQGTTHHLPLICPSCGNVTGDRVSKRTRQKIYGCLDFINCGWVYMHPDFKIIKPMLKKSNMEEYYIKIQTLADGGDEKARDALDELEKNWHIMYEG